MQSPLRSLLALAGPIILSQLGQMLLGVVDAVLAGHLGVQALDAVTLGNLWQTATSLPLFGVVLGLDPLVSQAHGAGRGDDVARAFQRALLIACVLAIPVGVSWGYTEPALLALGQRPELARTAAVYTRAQIFSAPSFLLYGAFNVYLTSRGIVRPGVIAMAIANLFNALVAWSLIFGHLGMPALGVTGGGIATGLTRWLLVVVLVLCIVLLRLHEGAWTPWSRAVLERRALGRQLALGIPVGITLALELWAFQLGTLISGRLGEVPLGAHSIAISLASLSFMVPLGISIGASALVGSLIGARKPEQAEVAAQTALKVCLGFALCAGALFLLARRALPGLYTRDPAVLALAAGVLPIAGGFQVLDALQTVSGGILRGMGRPRITAAFNLLGYFALGIPLAYYLGLHTVLGLHGVWIGYAAGLFVVASGLVSAVLLRGPRTVRSLVS